MSICSWFKKKPVVVEQTPKKPDLTWSNYLFDQIDRIYLKEFDDRAKDMARIHPKFKSMTRPERINVVCDLIRWLAYYESGWDPKSTSVDVGSKEDKDTWSIGLLQISVCDQKNMGLYTNYSFDDLLKPEPNLHLGLTILTRQIRRTGLVILPNKHQDRYWAVLLDGNKYSRVNEILARVQK